ADGRLVEVLDGGDLCLGEVALEGGVGALDPGDELRDVVRRIDLCRRDLPLVRIEAADELHLFQQVLGRVRHEIEDAVLLPNLGGEHAQMLTSTSWRRQAYRGRERRRAVLTSRARRSRQHPSL